MMNEIKNGGPAFPQDLDGRPGDNPFLQGMSLRDYFAAAALPGLLANASELFGKKDPLLYAPETAYKCADAMLKAREG